MSGMQVRDRPAPGRSFTAEASALMAIAGLLGGIAIGASGPLFVVIVSPAFVGGPTWGGLALFFGVCAAVVTGLVAMLTRHGRWWIVPVFAFSATLSLGVLAGTRVGPALGAGYRPPTPEPTLRPMSFPPPPVIREAPATVAVRFDDLPGYTVTRPEAYEGGLFGHWCSSRPDSTRVGHVDVLEAGRLNGEGLGVSMTLAGRDLPPVWIVVQVRNMPDGSVPYWRGEGTLVASEGATGRVTFEGLGAAGAPPAEAWPATLSGEIAWSCTPWPHESPRSTPPG